MRTVVSDAFGIDNAHYDIGIDWVNPYNSSAYTIGIIFVRCRSVKPRNTGKAWASAVVGIIPGPRSPGILSPYLQLLVDELLLLQDKGMSVTVTDPASGEARTFVHRAFLSAVLADTPARIKCGNHRGHASRCGACSWCRMEGVLLANPTSNEEQRQTSTVRHKGYSAAVEQPSHAL